jgi:hypothetical protein
VISNRSVLSVIVYYLSISTVVGVGDQFNGSRR